MNGSDGTPPSSPLFADAPGASPPTIGVNPWSEAEQAQIDKLKALIKDGKLGGNVPGVADFAPPPIVPYLLVRSFAGDNGTRPFNQVFWESPDIWTAPGEPANAPAIPPTHGGVVTAGEPNTVYALVWNLGRAPVTGVVVSFYWVNPSLAIDGANAHLIGMARTELGPRNSPLCRTLVKCPKPWVPVMENGGHECLIVKVWGFGDAAPATQWNPWQDRHVAQRNVAVVSNVAQMHQLVSGISLVAFNATARIELAQAGAEAKDAVAIVAPKLTINAAIPTQTLATLDGANVLTVAPPQPAVPRILPHLLTAPGAAATVAEHATAAVAPVTAEKLTVPNADLTTLLGHSSLFDESLLKAITAAPPPADGQANVLRIEQYEGTQLVGGYTLVIANTG